MRGLTYDLKIVVMLWNKMKYFNNHFINPAQITWVKWLRNQGALERSVRTINRYFLNLQNRQQITRIRRVRHDPKKGMVFQTTLYGIPYLGLLLLHINGVITWDELTDHIRNSRPFKAREPKREKKGIRRGDPDFYKDFTSYGGPEFKGI